MISNPYCDKLEYANLKKKNPPTNWVPISKAKDKYNTYQEDKLILFE